MKSKPWHQGQSTIVWLSLATMASATLASTSARAHEYIVFAWGSQLRVIRHSFDPEQKSVSLFVGQDDTVTVPVAAVAKVLDADEEVLIDLTFDTLRIDSAEPADTVPWIAIQGWSSEEVWDSWEQEPKWAYRWMDAAVAWVIIPPAPPAATGIELRMVPISYAIRRLADEPTPPLQTLQVSLNGDTLGEIALSDDSWRVYRLPLLEPSGGLMWLRLETSYLHRPADFSQGRNSDPRMLGVALDHVRFLKEHIAR